MTPRASGEPAVNKWISSAPPQASADVLVQRHHHRSGDCRSNSTGDLMGEFAGASRIDLLHPRRQPENQQAMAEARTIASFVTS